MQTYTVWYMRPEHFRAGILGAKPDPTDLKKTHIELKSIEAADLDDVFHKMQGEVWSPNGEARSLIRSKGLEHTSMSVGDVVVNAEGRVFVCATFGWDAWPPDDRRDADRVDGYDRDDLGESPDY